MAKILICDDHTFSLLGTKAYVEGLMHHVCASCDNGISAYNMILQQKPDIAILDMSMPGLNGLEILEKLHAINSPLPTKVILLTMHKELSIFKKAQSLQVKGYVLKEFSINVLGDCIDAVLRGEIWFSKELNDHLHIDHHSGSADGLDKLTFAEKKILELISKQHNTKEIAGLLFIAEKTVENHRHNIIKKLGLSADKNALLLWAVQNISVK